MKHALHIEAASKIALLRLEQNSPASPIDQHHIVATVAKEHNLHPFTLVRLLL